MISADLLKRFVQVDTIVLIYRGLVIGPGEAQRLVVGAGREEDQVHGESGPCLQRGDDQGAGDGGQGIKQEQGRG